MENIKGNVSSIETMGLVDGPGIRCVIFMQGCALRCKYCHNPETWQANLNKDLMSAKEVVDIVKKYRNYYGSDGGVTFSGGEPLLQPDFLLACLKLCKAEGINTALDTAGVGLGKYEDILKYTDLVILDVKAVENEEYKELTGLDNKRFLNFLDACQRNGNKLWLRQVIVPNLNDDERHILMLKEFASKLKNVEKIELLPYKTIGVHKYKALKLKYPLDGVPQMDESKCRQLQKILVEK